MEWGQHAFRPSRVGPGLGGAPGLRPSASHAPASQPAVLPWHVWREQRLYFVAHGGGPGPPGLCTMSEPMVDGGGAVFARLGVLYVQ